MSTHNSKQQSSIDEEKTNDNNNTTINNDIASLFPLNLISPHYSAPESPTLIEPQLDLDNDNNESNSIQLTNLKSQTSSLNNPNFDDIEFKQLESQFKQEAENIRQNIKNSTNKHDETRQTNETIDLFNEIQSEQLESEETIKQLQSLLDEMENTTDPSIISVDTTKSIAKTINTKNDASSNRINNKKINNDTITKMNKPSDASKNIKPSISSTSSNKSKSTKSNNGSATTSRTSSRGK
jgi:predicted  nucleic acid-binding Zn-ribbon protein